MPTATRPDFSLSDGRYTFDFKLKSGTRIYQQAISEDRALAIDISSQNKKIGEFDEQNDFRGGRGHESFSKNPTGYYDGQNAWTLNGMLMSGLQWRYAKGLRAGEDFSLPGSVSWVPLYTLTNTTNGLRYQSRSFVAGSTVTGANYNATILGFWIRKVGSPGTATFEIDNNSSGDPGTTRTSGTLTAAAFSNDKISHFVKIPVTSNTLTNGTTYHVKVFGASTDNKNNHWEIAVEQGSSIGKSSPDGTTWTTRNYGVYFWIASADIPRRLLFFQYDGVQYAVSQIAAGTASTLFMNGERGKATSGTTTSLTDTNAAFGTASKYVGAYVRILRGTGVGWIGRITSHTNTALTITAIGIAPDSTSEYVIYYTDVWKQITGHGLGYVTGRPVVLGSTVYFPQGATAMRRMRFNAGAAPPAHEFAADGTNVATFLAVGAVASGDKLYAAVNNYQIQVASPVTWPTNLTFAAAATVGKVTSRLNGIAWDENKNALVVYKEDGGYSISPNNQITILKYGFQNSESGLHGISSVTSDGMTYFTRGHSLVEEYGAQCSEIGLAWKGTGLKADRQGYFSALIAVQGWVIGALDAYTQFSSVNIYNKGNRSYHEIFQAPIAGERVRDIMWQSCEETGFNRLWIEINGYACYIDFPQLTNDPYYATANYQHETVWESSIIDKGTAARLPKYIKELVAVTENLGGGRRIYVDYLTDENVFTTAVARWKQAGILNVSPEDNALVNVWDILKLRFRLRMTTNNVNTPVVVRSIVPSGYARVPYKMQWTAQIVMAVLKVTGKTDPTELYEWLRDKARSSQPLTITSERYPTMNGYKVVIDPPSPVPTAPQRSRKSWRGIETLVMQEV